MVSYLFSLPLPPFGWLLWIFSGCPFPSSGLNRHVHHVSWSAQVRAEQRRRAVQGSRGGCFFFHWSQAPVSRQNMGLLVKLNANNSYVTRVHGRYLICWLGLKTNKHELDGFRRYKATHIARGEPSCRMAANLPMIYLFEIGTSHWNQF